ncbi:MAG: proline iminopeptidase-family hydrolase [Thermoplasmata archaeon]|nr:proline iminopeptidase-family hydrolase [Thermoplasmata archaeon]
MSTEGFVRAGEFRLFYRSFGEPRRGAVLALHGGPGASHDYLLPLADLTEDGYRVVLFDQLGCGRSDVPDDHSLFTLDHHVQETEAIRTELGLGQVHLVGSSYGGLLALAYALRHPGHLRTLVTVGGLASVPFASSEMARLRGELPREARDALDKGDSLGETHSPEYLRAVDAFYRTFLCRLDPWPDEVRHSLEMAAQRPVYAEMNGPNEFTITGSIRDIDLTGQLSRIRAPTLVLGGRYDEVTPRVAEQIRERIPRARRVEFAHSSHLPFWEERTAFHAVLLEFLRHHDGPSGA